MDIFGIGPLELVFVLVIALLVLGPGKMVEMARDMGKYLRDFQRATGGWLQKARQGNTVLILSPEGPPLTLKAGHPKPEKGVDWDRHFAWLRNQPEIQANPVDELRRAEDR